MLKNGAGGGEGKYRYRRGKAKGGGCDCMHKCVQACPLGLSTKHAAVQSALRGEAVWPLAS
jgi:succinate dehydrogenase/fumarate reductase-like Fe-S protein